MYTQLTGVVAAVLLSGCVMYHNDGTRYYSDVPMPTKFEAGKQKMLQAPQHWHKEASLLAGQLVRQLSERPALFIDDSQARTTFERIFLQQLGAALAARGYPLSRQAEGALRVELQTTAMTIVAQRQQVPQTITFARVPLGPLPVEQAGQPAAGQGTVVRVQPASSEPQLAALSEFVSGPLPLTELAVTVSVGDDTRYFAKVANVYYVVDADQQLYREPPVPAPLAPLPGKVLEVTGS